MGDSPVARRSEDFWFEDGDVVLSVTVDGVDHQFCVHRTILTVASPVFRDLFSMPEPSGLREHVRQPVPLLGDSVQDLNALLGALYCTRTSQILTHDVVVGIMRLSHKYQIEGLKQGMRQRLQEDWSFNRSNYLARCTYLGNPDYRIFQAIKLIETAQHCQANELLPTAFYELACAWGTHWEKIVTDLSPDNVIRLCIGRERSAQRLRAFLTGSKDLLMWNSSPPVTIYKHREKFPRICVIDWRDECVACGFPALRNKVSNIIFHEKSAAIPAIWRCERNDLSCCNGCKDWFMDILRNKVEELWESIPTDFDLPAVDPKLYSQRKIIAL